MMNVIDRYEDFLVHVKHASQNTIASYMRDIRQYASYLNIVPRVAILDVDRETVSQYTSH